MLLTITRHTDDSTGVTDTTFLLKDGTRRLEFPPYLGAAKLEALAERWFAIRGDGVRHDTNRVITRLGKATLADLVVGFKFSAADPILAAAVEERVKRAVWMIVEDNIYARYIFTTQEQVIQLALDSPDSPGGKALPDVSDAVRKYVKEKM
jgi:hypothetical protein